MGGGVELGALSHSIDDVGSLGVGSDDGEDGEQDGDSEAGHAHRVQTAGVAEDLLGGSLVFLLASQQQTDDEGHEAAVGEDCVGASVVPVQVLDDVPVQFVADGSEEGDEEGLEGSSTAEDGAEADAVGECALDGLSEAGADGSGQAEIGAVVFVDAVGEEDVVPDGAGGEVDAELADVALEPEQVDEEEPLDAEADDEEVEAEAGPDQLADVGEEAAEA